MSQVLCEKCGGGTRVIPQTDVRLCYSCGKTTSVKDERRKRRGGKEQDGGKQTTIIDERRGNRW